MQKKGGFVKALGSFLKHYGIPFLIAGGEAVYLQYEAMSSRKEEMRDAYRDVLEEREEEAKRNLPAANREQRRRHK